MINRLQTFRGDALTLFFSLISTFEDEVILLPQNIDVRIHVDTMLCHQLR